MIQYDKGEEERGTGREGGGGGGGGGEGWGARASYCVGWSYCVPPRPGLEPQAGFHQVCPETLI